MPKINPRIKSIDDLLGLDAAEERPIEKVSVNTYVQSATATGSADYEFLFSANCDGTLSIEDANGEVVVSDVEVKADTLVKPASVTLNKGKNVMSIKDEIDNMRSYLTIQQMMHDGDFDAVVDIEDGILQYNTLNLILQPLIENAIDHGIDLNTGVRGVITITGRGTEDEIILTVEDNGVGMTKEQADKIITKDSKGYGVRNVNERIKLYYGEQYELKIESEIGKGTKVIVHFPKML